MRREALKKIGTNVRMFLWMTLLTGVIYPLLITIVAQLIMKHKADGNFLSSKGKIVGAPLIAQKFESDGYFWARPSAIDYNPLPSGGSNLGPTSAKLKKAVEERQAKILKAHGGEKDNIPAELLFASGSGLDPHIKASTAYFQIERIAKSRGIENNQIKSLIDSKLIPPHLSWLDRGYVNVLLLNHALDALASAQQEKLRNE